MKTASSNLEGHRGFSVDLWTDRGAWFWRLASRCCRAGTIGSALTRNEAVREAHQAIEEVSARCTLAAQANAAARAVVSRGR